MFDSCAVEGSMSSVSGMAESFRGCVGSRSVGGGSSTSDKSGSVTHGALCRGVEDSRCSLLGCIVPSLLRVLMGLVDRDETD